VIMIETYIDFTDIKSDKILQAGELENIFSTREGFKILRHSIYKKNTCSQKADNSLRHYLVSFMAQFVELDYHKHKIQNYH